MKELPYVEDIYDLETEQLQLLLDEIVRELARGPQGAILPKGIETFDKFERKANKLRDCIELELEERSQVDNVISFFAETRIGDKLLDDDKFYGISSKTQSKNQPTSTQKKVDAI
jgi:hypothetical protein